MKHLFGLNTITFIRHSI